MRNLKINDGLFGKSYVSTLRNLLNIPDNQFIATNNIRIELDDLDDLINTVERFFVKVESGQVMEIVSVEKIIRKCSSVCIDSDEYATFCIDTAEHD